MKLISIVIPCYNSEATIRKVVEMVMEEFKKMDGYDCEFVLVNDGSPKDNTYGEIKKLGEQYQNVKGINLLRNFGQHNALMAALHYTEGDFILGMDDDMQTHPSQISKLIHKMEEGYDLVYGCYPKRKNSFLKNVTSKLNEFPPGFFSDGKRHRFQQFLDDYPPDQGRGGKIRQLQSLY